MRVLVTGSSGLVGSALVPALESAGHEVLRLVRREPREGANEARWDPASGVPDPSPLEGAGAAVHLAGENIASGRWTASRKALIRDSRVQGTAHLARALAGLGQPPRVLVAASAIGLYGDRGDEVLTEQSAPGTGFLAETCRDWEAASAPAEEKGVRVVRLRIGVVLSPKGGALAKVLPPFKMGVAGILGDGSQYMSWISLDDLVQAILRALGDEKLAGPVNAVAPFPVTNREFTKTLGKVLGRPTVLPMPAFAVRMVFGEMGRELLLASARVEPAVLKDAGFSFQHPQLESALRAVLER